MRKTTIAVLAAATMAAAAGSASAGTLTNVSVSLSDSRVSQPTDLTIRYTTATALNGTAWDNLLIADFGGLTLVNGPCGSDVAVKVNGAPLSTASMSLCSLAHGYQVQLRLDAGQTIPAGAAVEIVIDDVRVTTKATTGTYTATGFRTAQSTGTPIDNPATQPTYFIGTPPPAPVPTMTEWAMLLLTAALGGFAALTIQRRRRTV